MPIHTLSEGAGYLASVLVLLTFLMKDMRPLRITAILSNIAFIVYAALNWLPPVLVLHLLLLPVNVHRLREADR
jgi:CRP/FNR family transcriptional regulator, cyclic AMP receptor protein